MDFLLINDFNNSHYFYIKDFNKLMYNKTEHKEKKHFCRYCVQFFREERILIEDLKVFLKINGNQKIKTVGKGKHAVYRFIDAMLGEETYCGEVIDKQFNKNLVTNKDDVKDFIDSNKCWIYGRLYTEKDTRVRDHGHVTGKYRYSSHKSYNVNFKLSKKVPIVFHNLQGSDSHLIMQEIERFDDIENIHVISNASEKCVTFIIDKNLVFIDSMQFIISSIEKLAKNLLDDRFEYLLQEFSEDLVKLAKQKEVYPYKYMYKFEKYIKDILLYRDNFYNSLKD